jgi:probable rRNA maturation factor
VKIYSINRQRDLKVPSSFVVSIVRIVLQLEKTSCESLSVYFVTEKRICELHQQFFNDPSPTDCISFPINKEILGEVFVCPRTALRYVKKHGGDPYREVALYIIHGVLHLLGYDDLEPSQRRVMRKKEKRCMERSNELGVFS